MREPSTSLLSMLLLAGCVQNVSLALMLAFARKGNRLANRLLAAILVVFSLSLMDGFLFQTNYYFRFPNLFGVEWPTAFLYGPLAFFYVRALASSGAFALRWNHLLHLIPFGIHIVLLTPLYLLTSEEKARLLGSFLDQLEKEPGFHLDPMLLVLVIQMAVYLIVSLRLITAYSAKLKQSFSSVEKINLSWLRDIYIALFSLWCMFSLASAFGPRYGVYKEAVFFVRLMEAAVIFVMAVKGLRRSRIFTGPVAFHEIDITPIIKEAPAAAAGLHDIEQIQENASKPEKYRKSSLTDEQASGILRQLGRTMETERPFLEPELTLPELSGRLSVSPNHLSQVINGVYKKSFFDFINEYRVREARKLLRTRDYDHFSILGIAMEAGFNSKNAFYSAFKKYTGMTPAQFRERRDASVRSEDEVSTGAFGNMS